jgi:hypothetical protein
MIDRRWLAFKGGYRTMMPEEEEAEEEEEEEFFHMYNLYRINTCPKRCRKR